MLSFHMTLHLPIQCAGVFTFITRKKLSVVWIKFMNVNTHSYVGTTNVSHKFFLLLRSEVTIIAFFVLMITFQMVLQLIC